MLQRLADSVKQLGVPGYMPYMIKGTDTATGQNVGLLTLVDPIVSLTRTSNRQNYPVVGSGCKFTGPAADSAVSKHYSTQFYVNGLRLAMIGAHLVAFPVDPSRCAQREAQATVLRGLVDQVLSDGLEVILLGFTYTLLSFSFSLFSSPLFSLSLSLSLSLFLSFFSLSFLFLHVSLFWISPSFLEV